MIPHITLNHVCPGSSLRRAFSTSTLQYSQVPQFWSCVTEMLGAIIYQLNYFSDLSANCTHWCCAVNSRDKDLRCHRSRFTTMSGGKSSRDYIIQHWHQRHSKGNRVLDFKLILVWNNIMTLALQKIRNSILLPHSLDVTCCFLLLKRPVGLIHSSQSIYATWPALVSNINLQHSELSVRKNYACSSHNSVAVI